MARKPLPADKTRPRKLQVTLSDAEADWVQQHALSASTPAKRVSASDVIRAAVQRYMRAKG